MPLFSSFFSEQERRFTRRNSPRNSRTEDISARFKNITNLCTSDTVKFYIIVAFFFAMVFILPMIPMLMFIYTENSPSINPQVFKELFHNIKQDV